MQRGEVRWYKFTAPDKKRPVLILTRNSIIPYLSEITIAPITTTVRNIPSEVEIGKLDGLKTHCAVNLDHLQTVAKQKIGAKISALSSEKMEDIFHALSFALGFK